MTKLMAQKPLHQELNTIYKELSLLPLDAISFAGETFSTQQTWEIYDTQTQLSTMHPMVKLLQNTLYQYAYVQNFKGSLQKPTSDYNPKLIEDFVAQLSQANGSSDYCDEGWQIVNLGNRGKLSLKKAL